MNEEYLDYKPSIGLEDGEVAEATTQPSIYPDKPLPSDTGEEDQEWNLIRGESL